MPAKFLSDYPVYPIACSLLCFSAILAVVSIAVCADKSAPWPSVDTCTLIVTYLLTYSNDHSAAICVQEYVMKNDDQ